MIYGGKMKRIDWDSYYMEMAKVASLRATCTRKSVGAIVVSNLNRIIGTGYNGAPSDMEHCTDVGCLIQKDADQKPHCIRTIHAETNALLQAGKDAMGATLYTTASPCPICFKLLIQCGIVRVVYGESYNKDDVQYWVDNSGVEMVRWQV